MAFVDYGASGRRDSYEFCLVSPFTLKEIGKSIDVFDGKSSLTWVYGSENIATGSLSAACELTRDYLVRIKHTIEINGETFTETLGTYFIEGGEMDGWYGKTESGLSLYSTLWRHTQDFLITDFWHPIGTLVTDEIKQLVEVDGGHMYADHTCPPTLHTRDVWFEVGTNKGEVLRTIAGWINCEIGVDDYGYITLSAYREPHTRPIHYTFENGNNCICTPGANKGDDRDECFNRVLAYWSRSSIPKHAVKDAEGHYVKDENGETVYQNDDPYGLFDSAVADLDDIDYGSPFSYKRIGRHKSYVLRLSDPCSHDEVFAAAKKYLLEHCGNTITYEIEHPSVPGLRVGQCVRYKNDRDFDEPVNCVCMIEQIEMQLDKGCMCKTQLRKVR